MNLKESSEAFLIAVDNLGDAAADATFSYISISSGQEFELLQGRMLVGALKPVAPLGSFGFEHVRAGSFQLSAIGISVEAFIKCVLEGKIPTPEGELLFSGNDTGARGGHYQTFHPEAATRGERLRVLSIFGRDPELQQRRHELDWSVRAAPTPFDSLQELMMHYHVGPLHDDVVTFEAAILGVVAVDRAAVVTGETCDVAP